MRVIELLKRESVNIIGFYCPEVREGGVRIGFKIIDISDGEEGWLAVAENRYTGACSKRVGRYCVVESDASKLVNKLEKRFHENAVIAIDEVGPMELKIDSLRRFIEKSLSSNKPGLYVVHERIVHDIAKRYGVEDVLRIDERNRGYIHEEIYRRIINIIAKK